MKKILFLICTIAATGGVYAQEVGQATQEVAREATVEAEQLQEAQRVSEELAREIKAAQEATAGLKAAEQEAQEATAGLRVVEEEAQEEVEKKSETAKKTRQQKEYDPRATVPKRHYINFALASQKMQSTGQKTLKTAGNSYAVEMGSTFFFNAKKPILIPYAGALRIGLDYTYLDATWAEFELDDKSRTVFGNLGWQLGPSVTLTPLRRLHVRLYGHYAPSVVAYSADSKFKHWSYGYAGYVTGGMQVSYRFLTVGLEWRSSTAKLKSVGEDEGQLLGFSFGPKTKVKLPGSRFIVGFRF